jgi:hypothetical protein
MGINQVLVEGTLVCDPGESLGCGAFAYFDIVDDREQLFRCKMWLGHRSHCCRPGDLVLAIGHLNQAEGEVQIQVVSLRKLAKQTWPPLTSVRDAPERDPGADQIPF